MKKNYQPITCEDESDQRLYDRITADEYPITSAQIKWADEIVKHNGLAFRNRPKEEQEASHD